MNKLAIERRVQYGAEKMLDVSFSLLDRHGPCRDPSQACSSGANGHHRSLSRGAEEETAANRTRSKTGLRPSSKRPMSVSRSSRRRWSACEGVGCYAFDPWESALMHRVPAGTPQRPRRRPQPKLNGYASTSSLGQSLGSSSFLSSRPRPSRHGSALTPDREREYFDSPAAAAAAGTSGQVTPSRHGGSPSLFSSSGRARSRSTGGESDVTSSDGPTRFDSSRSRSGLSSPGEMVLHVEDGDTYGAPGGCDVDSEEIEGARDAGTGEGEGTDTEPGDEVWGCLNRLAETLKKSGGLKALLNTEEVVQW